jgi:hypothetical protein
VLDGLHRRKKRLTLLLVNWLSCSAWRITSLIPVSTFYKPALARASVFSQTYKHLLILANPNTLALDNLEVLEAAQNIVVDLKGNLNTKVGALLDCEGLVLQLVERARGRDIDNNIWAALNFKR